MRIAVTRVVFGGDDWLIAYFDEHASHVERCAAFQAAAQKLRRNGTWLEVVPSTCDIAVRFDAMVHMPNEAKELLVQTLAFIEPPSSEEAEVMRIPVCYSGDYALDLAYCAKILKLRQQDIITLHTAAPLLVEMMGFAPGFAYCGQTPPALSMSRLDEPRTRVTQGSIGIVGCQTCIYSLPSPGGWPIIGRTPRRLFNAKSATPFVLRAGTVVHFYAIDETRFRAMQER